ncbi:carbohydrate ABC transporter membrane protein 1, CUT1 family [Pelagirhabdus alkalitolerans]|uniref:Carbohydrate ABC transporter membrane protein 1, CUT1 family n=1 Tax=Pelagirhabdus alkalitolerans TaxID=1612202 RepID=A0A1G6L3X7_9BACI|nr:sugar ABC transporter permease [Pelagirhabdus alkalitolerans]SDC37823.1 carbohydrate ABC transporter membrane protein 1, CUT1 family [Pelagirhabdus alkalitolerans]
MDKVMSNKWVIFLYLLPATLMIGVLVYIPIAVSGYFGLFDWDGVGAMNFIGLQNYTELLTDSTFWFSARNSFYLALFSTLALVVYLGVALVLSSKVKGRELFRKIYLIPMLLSSVAIAQLWIRVYDPNNGFLNTFLRNIGFDNPPAWLAERDTVLFAIFVAIVWQFAGFYIIIYTAALKGISEELVEAAEIDGASPLQIATRIKVPLISGVIKTTVVLAIVGSLKYFDLIWVMTGGGPNGASEVLASYMYKEAFNRNNFGYGSAIGFALLILALLTTVVIQKITKSKESQ